MAKVMLKVNGDKGGGPEPKKVVIPGHEDTPLYMPTDNTDGRILLTDNRSVNPATGQPFGKDRMGTKTMRVHPNIIKAIVAHAKAKGIDPYDALAIPYQETGFGAAGTGLGENKDYFPDKGVEDNFDNLDEANMNMEANAMVKAMADKFKYAKSLGFANKGKDYMFQAYNGYGKLRPQAGEHTTSFYGIPVSHDNPLDMARNPVYGRVVSSLRNVLASNPQVKKIVETTPAFKSVWDQPQQSQEPPQAARKVMLKVSK
jgi:hypothetical protein